MKFIRVKMGVFVPTRRTVASNVLAEMDMVDYCVIKKVYDAYHFDSLFSTNINIFMNYIMRNRNNSVAVRFFLVCVHRFFSFHCCLVDALYASYILEGKVQYLRATTAMAARRNRLASLLPRLPRWMEI